MSLDFRRLGMVGVALFGLNSGLLADTVKLKTGEVIEGTVIPQSGGYWVKDGSGTVHRLKSEEVASVTKGSGGATPGAGGATAGSAGTTPPRPGAASFSASRTRASMVDSALAAVAIWQSFVDNAPADSPDLPAAKAELAKWKTLADSSAEKIKGKWIGGDERQKILDQAAALQKEGEQLVQKNQTLAAVKKFEEAANVYPNSFETTFSMAHLYMVTHDEKKANEWLAKAAAIRPDAQEVLGNQGVLYCAKRQYEKGVPLLMKALQKGDRAEIVQDLLVALVNAPPAFRNRKDMKEAEGAVRLLAGKYKLSSLDSFVIIPLYRDSGNSGSAKHEQMWSGTGFVIAGDGLILTNRHVVDGAKTLMVTLQGLGEGGKDLTRSAEVVVIDDQQDLALVRVKATPGKPFATVSFSPNDSPPDGAECTVLGYPLLDRLGASVKITRGIVTSSRKEHNFDVMIDAKVNPGNSGGPVFDRFGNVMAIVSMKTISSETEDTYGLAISAGMVRQFLAKNSVKLSPGKVDGKSLNTEEVAAKAKPCTVCILATK